MKFGIDVLRNILLGPWYFHKVGLDGIKNDNVNYHNIPEVKKVQEQKRIEQQIDKSGFSAFVFEYRPVHKYG